jgi:hypothetical protein
MRPMSCVTSHCYSSACGWVDPDPVMVFMLCILTTSGKQYWSDKRMSVLLLCIVQLKVQSIRMSRTGVVPTTVVILSPYTIFGLTLGLWLVSTKLH